ncbi:MAG: hypothetical protein JHC95_10260 [Solirubrobacteraceae bacterium]|nr:hypothetical protein [Solirubrobacteraceae bacterium]
MASRQAARTAPRRIRIRRARVAALLVVIAAITVALDHEPPAPSSTAGSATVVNEEVPGGEAVAKYGSEQEAARWVASPTTSAHVSGDAVDIGPSGAAAWLAEHGAAYGLCQIYGNEPWHYELRPEAVDRGCPPLYADPTHDPRMQQ